TMGTQARRSMPDMLAAALSEGGRRNVGAGWPIRRNHVGWGAGSCPTPFRHVAPQTARLSDTRGRGVHMRLLVIEDNRNLVANLFAYFEARGHVLDAAPDGITGLHLALTQPYDALILDWMLPRMDGPELLRKLRNEG